MREGKTIIQYNRLYAYEKGEDGKPKIIQEQADVVRSIYDQYLSGASLRMIKDRLEAEQIPNVTGGSKWTITAIRSILTNEKYCGDVLLQKTYISDCISRKVIRNTGQLPMYLVQNHHEGIVERKTFDAVQAEMARRSAGKSPSKKNAPTGMTSYASKYALSERLVCGECGTLYRRCTWSKQGRKRIVWRCVSRLDYGTKYCHNSPTLDEEPLQKAILAAINSVMSQKSTLIRQITSAMEMELAPVPGESMDNAQHRLFTDLEGEINDLPNREEWGGEDLDTAMGILDRYMAEAIESGDYGKVNKWAKLIQSKGTKAGQMIQAFAKYSRTPQGVMVDAVRTLENSKLNDQKKAEVLSNVQEQIAAFDDIQDGDTKALIDLIKQNSAIRRTGSFFRNKTSKALNAALEQDSYDHLRDVALAQIDSIAKDYKTRTTGEKLRSARSMFMLSNVTTILRNFVGNQIFDPIDSFAGNTSEQRLREVRPSDWHGSGQPAEYVPDLRRRFCRQDAPADGLYRPPRRGSRSVVHRRFRHDLAGCGGRLPGIATKNNQQGGADKWTSWLSRERKLVYNGIPSEMILSA